MSANPANEMPSESTCVTNTAADVTEQRDVVTSHPEQIEGNEKCCGENATCAEAMCSRDDFGTQSLQKAKPKTAPSSGEEPNKDARTVPCLLAERFRVNICSNLRKKAAGCPFGPWWCMFAHSEEDRRSPEENIVDGLTTMAAIDAFRQAKYNAALANAAANRDHALFKEISKGGKKPRGLIAANAQAAKASKEASARAIHTMKGCGSTNAPTDANLNGIGAVAHTPAVVNPFNQPMTVKVGSQFTAFPLAGTPSPPPSPPELHVSVGGVIPTNCAANFSPLGPTLFSQPAHKPLVQLCSTDSAAVSADHGASSAGVMGLSTPANHFNASPLASQQHPSSPETSPETAQWALRNNASVGLLSSPPMPPNHGMRPFAPAAAPSALLSPLDYTANAAALILLQHMQLSAAMGAPLPITALSSYPLGGLRAPAIPPQHFGAPLPPPHMPAMGTNFMQGFPPMAPSQQVNAFPPQHAPRAYTAPNPQQPPQAWGWGGQHGGFDGVPSSGYAPHETGCPPPSIAPWMV